MANKTAKTWWMGDGFNPVVKNMLVKNGNLGIFILDFATSSMRMEKSDPNYIPTSQVVYQNGDLPIPWDGIPIR